MSKSGQFASGTEALTQTSGTYTPALLFGGSSTGITGTFVGSYVRTGAQVDLQVTITLTNKGSATGNATITLPFLVSGTSGFQKTMPMFPQNVTSTGSTYTTFAARVNSGVVTASLFNFSQSASAAVALADTNFSNTSVINITGTYWTGI